MIKNDLKNIVFFKYYKMEQNNIPILTIGDNQSFTIIELIDINTSLKIKVRLSSNDINLIQEKYNRIKKLVNNPIIIINFPISDISYNLDTIMQFYLNLNRYIG